MIPAPILENTRKNLKVEDSYIGCGLSKLWATPNGEGTAKADPFTPACIAHDKAYTEGSFEQKWFTRKQTDQGLLYHMLEIADDNFLLQCKAYLYYGLVRMFAGSLWEGKV